MGKSGTAVIGNARRWSKPRSSSRAASIRSRPWPAPRHCEEQIKLQVGLANALYHTKGFSASETKAAIRSGPRDDRTGGSTRRARRRPTRALFSILYGFFVANVMAFNGEASCAIATQSLELAEKQRASAPYDWASSLGQDLYLGGTSPKGERISIKHRALRSRRPSFTGGPIW